MDSEIFSQLKEARKGIDMQMMFVDGVGETLSDLEYQTAILLEVMFLFGKLAEDHGVAWTVENPPLQKEQQSNVDKNLEQTKLDLLSFDGELAKIETEDKDVKDRLLALKSVLLSDAVEISQKELYRRIGESNALNDQIEATKARLVKVNSSLGKIAERVTREKYRMVDKTTRLSKQLATWAPQFAAVQEFVQCANCSIDGLKNLMVCPLRISDTCQCFVCVEHAVPHRDHEHLFNCVSVDKAICVGLEIKAVDHDKK